MLESVVLGKRLKELRRINNYTQDYVASILGVIRQTYSHYETGKRTPSSENLYKLASLYNISVDDLLHLTIQLDKNIYYDDTTTTQSSDDLAAYLEFFSNPSSQRKFQYNTNLEKELLYYFQKISDTDKKEIIEFTKIKANRKHDL